MTRALAALVLFAALPSQALTNHSGPYELQVLIGVAIFPERWYPPPRPQPLYPPPPAPWNGGLRGDLKERERGSPAPEAEQGAPATAPPASPLARKSAERPGLGTEFGEAVSSQVTEVPFERAHERPEVVI